MIVYKIINDKFLAQFGSQVLAMKVKIFCSVCDEEIKPNKGVNFSAHGFNLCQKCVENIAKDLNK